MTKKNKTKDQPNQDNEVLEQDIIKESELEMDEALEDEDPLEKIHSLEEALLRSRAELDNALKRSVADIEKAHKYGVEK